MSVVVTHNVILPTDARVRAKAAALTEAAAYRHQGAAKRHCPVDTGRLRASISVRKTGNLVWIVFTVVEYGRYQEYGTARMSAQPFFLPGFEETLQEVLNSFRGVYASL